MKTFIVPAWQVEEGDFIILGSDVAFMVEFKDDTENGITLTVRDDDMERAEFSFMPFEDISVVGSFEEDD